MPAACPTRSATARRLADLRPAGLAVRESDPLPCHYLLVATLAAD
jgi:hypothetical protein